MFFNAYQNSKFKSNVKLIELCQNLLRIYYIIFTSVLLSKKKVPVDLYLRKIIIKTPYKAIY